VIRCDTSDTLSRHLVSRKTYTKYYSWSCSEIIYCSKPYFFLPTLSTKIVRLLHYEEQDLRGSSKVWVVFQNIYSSAASAQTSSLSSKRIFLKIYCQVKQLLKIDLFTVRGMFWGEGKWLIDWLIDLYLSILPKIRFRDRHF